MQTWQLKPGRWRWMLILIGAARVVCGLALPAAGQPAERFEKEILAFEAQDRQRPPTPGGVMFLGSSSIRLWNLAQSFPELPAVNRGFGGSHIADSVRVAERIVIPHQPRLIVFYAGDNDIAAGKTADQVLADYQVLVEKIHARLPKTHIAFLAIKPCPSRWKFYDVQRQANRLVEGFSKTDRRLVFVDVVKPMLQDDGTPRPELFQPDKLHLNPTGYKLWTDILTPHLASP